MKQINLITSKDFALKYWAHIALVLSLLFLFSKCNDNDQLSLAVDTQKEVTKQYKQNAKEFINKADSLEKVKIKLLKNIVLLQKDSIKSQVEISRLKIKVNTQLAAISHYKTTDIAKYFQSRYNDKKGVVVTQYGVALSDTIAKQNISEQVVCDGAKEEMVIVKSDLQKQKTIVKDQDKVIANSEQQNVNLHLSIVEINKAFESQEATVKASEKIFKKERNKKNFWKITTGVVIAASAYLFVTQ